jgi:aminobenzoyl-glutamate transport protein
MNFTPLTTLIVGLIGVGVVYKSGFLNTFYKMITKNRSRKLFTFIVVLFGVIGGMFSDAGYVILLPLAAILFLNLGRHPSAGICAAFAGITFGYGANVVVNGLDVSLVNYTGIAASILDTTYKANISGNIFMMIVATFLIAYLGMIITEKFIIPKLGKYNFSEEENFIVLQEPTTREKKGVILALCVVAVVSLILIYCIIPGLPFSGLLLYLKDEGYVQQLFGSNSYFSQGSVVIFSVLLIIMGLVYGLRTKSFKNNWDLVDGMNYYLKDMSSILILIFFAAQFCLIFKQTNIGVFIVASLSELLGNLELSGLVLIIVTFLITAIATIFVPTASTKWAILAPIVVPMFMQNSFTAEYAQAVFRAGNSASMGITPLFSYFVVLIGFLQIYNKKKSDTITITDTMSLMAPYTIAYTVLWLIIVIAFYILGVPLGFGTSVML